MLASIPREITGIDPATVLTPLSAASSYADEGVTCTVDGFAGPVRAGLHQATGGDGSDACRGDMLLEALLACAGVTLHSRRYGDEARCSLGTLRAESTFDARGTLGVTRDVPVGIGEVTVTADLDTDAPRGRTGPVGHAHRALLRGRAESAYAAVHRRAVGDPARGLIDLRHFGLLQCCPGIALLLGRRGRWTGKRWTSRSRFRECRV